MSALTRPTIAAIATATGRGGVGIIRLSGHELSGMAAQLAANLGVALRPRYAHYTDFLDKNGEVLDTGLLFYFPAPHSFTGEDVIEIQGHGGPVVMKMLLQRCLELGATMANPGEFTQRAFLNNKMDLAQAESVADLINANSEQAAKSALNSLKGDFSVQINALLDGLIQLRMLVEATLDFPEEEIDFLEAADAYGKLSRLQTQLQTVLASAKQGAILREGIHIVLIGEPNVGKSSLMNALAGEDVAIVTDIAGTTRDTVRETIQIEGVTLYIIDTAGLRETDDVVEKIGIARTWQAIEKADLALVLSDSRRPSVPEDILARLPASLPQLFVYNKIDTLNATEKHSLSAKQGWPLSAKTGEGLADLRRIILETVGFSGNTEGVFLARARHLQALQTAAAALERAQLMGNALDLLAEELRLAQLALSEITGAFSADDLLGVIFSEFCIGK